MPDPLVLGFSTSGPSCAGALLRGADVLSARHEDMQKGQAERLMPMLEEMLAEAHVAWSDLDRLGVGIGPGNFTGIRLAVSAARGLALGLKIPAIGVNSFDALALGSTGPVLICIDARGGKAYLQLYGRGAFPDMAAAIHSLEDLPPDLFGKGLPCIGSAATAVAERIGGTVGPAIYYPGSAVARIAAQATVRDGERPTPYYLRAADAAPSRDVAPTILP